MMLSFSVFTSAPKTYCLANTAQVDTGGISDKSILKVSLLFQCQVSFLVVNVDSECDLNAGYHPS